MPVEELSQFLFQHHPKLMCLYNPVAGRPIAFNNAFVDCYGETHEELLSWVTAGADASDSSDAPASKVRHLRDRDGKKVWCETAAHEVLFEGAPARLLVADDISEQRQTEAIFTEAEAWLPQHL